MPFGPAIAWLVFAIWSYGRSWPVTALAMMVLPQSTDWGRLRTLIAERVLVYAGVPGLRSKAFVLDERTGDYGANKSTFAS